MNKIEIFGWSTDQRFDDWREKFTQEYDNDCEELYSSIETFRHDADDEFDFKYKMCVKFVDYREFGGEGIGYELMMVVMPESLHKTHIGKICADYDFSPDRIELRDVIDDVSAVVRFAGGQCEEWDEKDGILLRIAHVFEAMNRLRGFYIDKCWNCIGSTGWDTLGYAINGTDLFQPAFDRYKEEMKEAV